MELYGWDMIYGASADVINRQLAENAKTLITDFHYQRNDADLGVNIEIRGQFDHWTVTKGGSNKLVHIAIPILNGQMVVTGKTDILFKNSTFQAGQPIDLSGLEITVEMSLSFKVSASNPGVKELSFDLNADTGTSSGVKPIALNDPLNRLPTASLKGFFKQISVEILAANRDKVSFVFASVLTQGGKNNWAALRYIDFYYSEPAGAATGFFTILGLTTRDTAAGLDDKIDPAFMKNPGTDLYIGISKDIFLQNVIQPLLPGVIGHGTTAATFFYDLAGHRVIGLPFGLGNLSEGGITYHPMMMLSEIHVEDNAIRTSFTGACDISPGIVEKFSFSYHNAVSFNNQKKTFEIAADPQPVINHSEEIEWWVWLLTAGLGGLAITGIVAGIAACISNAIGGSMDQLGNSLHFDSLSGLPIAWNGMRNDQWKVLSGGLSNHIFIIGQY